MPIYSLVLARFPATILFLYFYPPSEGYTAKLRSYNTSRRQTMSYWYMFAMYVRCGARTHAMLFDRISNTIHRRLTLHLLPDVAEFFRKTLQISGSSFERSYAACSCFAEICLRFIRQRFTLTRTSACSRIFSVLKHPTVFSKFVRMSVLCFAKICLCEILRSNCTIFKIAY